MIIGGLQKFSVLDFPGHLSAIIFTQGCNFRCQFCYNPVLVLPKDELQDNETINEVDSCLSEGDLFNFLEKRVGKLDAVVITGGEPTMHQDLSEFIGKIRQMGFKVKLDTNGTNSQVLQNLLDKKILDYVAMDLKAPPHKYDLVTGVQPNLEEIKKSIKIITGSSLPHEFRTTVVPELIELNDIEHMGRMIRGAQKWFLQSFKSDIDLVNQSFKGEKPFTGRDMEEMRNIGAEFVGECVVR